MDKQTALPMQPRGGRGVGDTVAVEVGGHCSPTLVDQSGREKLDDTLFLLPPRARLLCFFRRAQARQLDTTCTLPGPSSCQRGYCSLTALPSTMACCRAARHHATRLRRATPALTTPTGCQRKQSLCLLASDVDYRMQLLNVTCLSMHVACALHMCHPQSHT